MTSRILEELTDVAGDTADPKRPPSSDRRWALLLDTIEQRRKLVDSLRKNAAAVVPVERVMAFVHAVTNVVLEVVPDVRLKTLFLERLRLLMGRRPDPVN